MTKWWATPNDTVTFESLTPRLDLLFDKKIKGFVPGEPIALSLRGVMIHKAMDTNKTNDLMIVTTAQFGEGIYVPRVPFIQNDVKPGWQGDFFNDTIVTFPEIPPGWNRLTLQLQIYDLDHVNSALIAQISALFDIVGAIFMVVAPVAGPYAALLGNVPFLAKLLAKIDLESLEAITKRIDWKGAADALKKIEWKKVSQIVENLEKHDRIIDERITLDIAEEETGHKLLQPGYFVCFGDSLDKRRELYLNSDLQVYGEDAAIEFGGGSYAVVEIKRAFETDRLSPLSKELEQKINAEKDAESSKILLEYVSQLGV